MGHRTLHFHTGLFLLKTVAPSSFQRLAGIYSSIKESLANDRYMTWTIFVIKVIRQRSNIGSPANLARDSFGVQHRFYSLTILTIRDRERPRLGGYGQRESFFLGIVFAFVPATDLTLDLYADLPHCPDDRALRRYIHHIPPHYVACGHVCHVAKRARAVTVGICLNIFTVSPHQY
jgi:hypothetical protein